MNNKVFWLKYALLIFAQTLLSAFFISSPCFYITLLPVLLLFIPMEMPTPRVLLIVFFSGIFVDFLSASVVGITSASLLVCAFISKPVIGLIFGRETLVRKENLSVSRHGWGKILAVSALFVLVFLICYVLLDAAGTRGFGFVFSRICLSMIMDFIISILIILFICSDR